MLAEAKGAVEEGGKWGLAVVEVALRDDGPVPVVGLSLSARRWAWLDVELAEEDNFVVGIDEWAAEPVEDDAPLALAPPRGAAPLCLDVAAVAVEWLTEQCVKP